MCIHKAVLKRFRFIQPQCYRADIIDLQFNAERLYLNFTKLLDNDNQQIQRFLGSRQNKKSTSIQADIGSSVSVRKDNRSFLEVSVRLCVVSGQHKLRTPRSIYCVSLANRSKADRRVGTCVLS